MLINYVLLPDEWDVVGAYKDIKTDAHQLRRGQKDVPMGPGDGFLQLLAPHLPVGGAEKAKQSEMPHAAGGKHPSPTAHPVASMHLFYGFYFTLPVPPTQVPGINPSHKLRHIFALFLSFWW